MSLNKFTIQKSFAINAGAGSGKTYTLSRRYINCVLGFDFFKEDISNYQNYYETLKPARVNEIVTITYTEAAALEMKERIFSLMAKIANFEKLSNNRQDDDFKSIKTALESLDGSQQLYVNQTLNQALKDSSNARISTIHSFCMDIIKSNSDLAKFDGSLDVAKEFEKDALIKEAIFDTLNNESNFENANILAKDLNMFLLNSLFAKYLTSSKFRGDFNSFSEDSLPKQTLKKLLADLHPVADMTNIVDNIIFEFQNKNFPQNYIDLIQAYIDGFKEFNAKKLSELAKEMGAEINLKKKEFKEIKDEISELRTLDGLVSVYSEIDENLENLFYQKINILKSIMIQMKDAYDQKLKNLGKIDFDEIIQKASQIANKIPKTIKYMMVDEFQDTNSLQYQIIKDSLDDTTNLFVVGDSKQSIYSFQGAQIEVFNNAIEDRTKISSIEPMSINYRSDGIVLNNVNQIFEHILKTDDSISLVKQNYEASFQELKVSKEAEKTLGTFKFLLTKKDSLEDVSNEEEDDNNELQNIANFISNIKSGNTEYENIKQLIEQKKKAIAIVFDSSTKMLDLKTILDDMNIEAKVSASENFFHANEITDLFFVLKSINLILQKNFAYNEYTNFYLSGAYRSSIFRYSDNEIAQFIKQKQIAPKLKELADSSSQFSISQLVANIFEQYSLETIYEHFNSSEQRKANFNKFLTMAIEFEKSSGDDIDLFLKTLQNNIFFNEHGENEAFFKSDNLESIEICTIHSTKGLAYPMVILANSQKALYSQIQSDSIKNNNFELTNGETKQIAGFKINGYEPLAFRLLKKVDKLKHLAEKKRLLYVAITRAEHDVIISGTLTKTKKGDISLREDSYLSMILSGLEIDKNEIFEDIKNFCLPRYEKIEIASQKVSPQNTARILLELSFTNKKPISATTKTSEKQSAKDDSRANLGTVIHKIFELYSKMFDSVNNDLMFAKFEIIDENQKSQILLAIKNFQQSEIYQKLQNGAKHYFELEFNHNDKTGFIDLVYFDESKAGWVIVDFKSGLKTEESEIIYQKQLQFYEDVLKENKMVVVERKILWV